MLLPTVSDEVAIWVCAGWWLAGINTCLAELRLQFCLYKRRNNMNRLDSKECLLQPLWLLLQVLAITPTGA
jgi:hypothetical protein